MNYIFMAARLSGTGGGEVYLKRKVSFLLDEGFHVAVCAPFDEGQVSIKSICPSVELIPELRLSPRFFSSRKRDEIIRKIGKILPLDNDVIIESMTIPCSLWGELVANRLKARHYLFLLNESFRRISNDEYEYLKFKTNRTELRTISFAAWQNLFSQKKLADRRYYRNVLAPCVDVVGEYVQESIQNRFTIGTIGRLEKNYVSTMMKGVQSFCHLHREVNILFDVIGSSSAGIIENQRKRIDAEECNITIVLHGNIFPFDLSLMNKWDAAIASAGSARIPASCHIPTIAMSMVNGLPLGLLGVDVSSCDSPSTGEISVEDLLNRIYQLGIDDEEWKYKIDLYADQNSFTEHYKYYKEGSNLREYYPTEMIKPGRYELLVNLFALLGIDISFQSRIYHKFLEGAGH